MNKSPLQKKSNQSIGVWYAILAFLTWGAFPIFWKTLNSVPALEILAHRILWSFVIVTLIVISSGQWQELKRVLSNRSSWIPALISSVLISANWFIYIWAVNANHILETSLGYYINPLLSIFLGMIVLKEKLNFWQLMALFFAFIGVVVSTVQFGQVPWVALSLAITFGLYGLSKKLTKFQVNIGLFMETLFVMPIAISYLVYLQMKGIGSFGVVSLQMNVLFLLSGIITLLPLIWFALATKHANLSTIGFIQYMTPTMTLLLGVFIYGEAFSKLHLISFSFIWFALLLYSFSQSRWLLQLQPSYFKTKSIRLDSSSKS